MLSKKSFFKNFHFKSKKINKNLNKTKQVFDNFKYDLENYRINQYNRSFKLIQKLVHPNFYQIDLEYGKKMIEIEKIRKSFNFSNRSSFNNQKRIILINNINHLSKSSANARSITGVRDIELTDIFLPYGFEKKKES